MIIYPYIHLPNIQDRKDIVEKIYNMGLTYCGAMDRKVGLSTLVMRDGLSEYLYLDHSIVMDNIVLYGYNLDLMSNPRFSLVNSPRHFISFAKRVMTQVAYAEADTF